MLVELFSVPGAGKTTLAKAAASSNPLVGRHDLRDMWRGQSRFRRSASIARALLNRERIGAAARLAIGVPLTDRQSLVRLVRLVAKTDRLRSQSGSLLLDQGFLQDLWSILYSARSEPDPEQLARLIRALYRSIDARIVFIDVDSETALKRLSGRDYGRSRLDGLPDAEVRSSLSRTARLPHIIVESARRAGLKVETFDGSEPVDLLLERLQRLLPVKQ